MVTKKNVNAIYMWLQNRVAKCQDMCITLSDVAQDARVTELNCQHMHTGCV
jgi:copper(I)-binding protein